jgi:diguanylate cyclase (GGDEF)-like protein/PAS domain S-box-containing protein
VPDPPNVTDPPNPDEADALRQLVNATERFPSLFSLSNEPCALYARDGTFVAGNEAARALIRDPIGGFRSGRHIEASALARAGAQFDAALAGEAVEFESVLTNHDGGLINVIARLVPALVDEKIVGVFGSVRDITQRRRAEVSRDESRDQFRSLFEQHPDSISMVDANGRYERMNAAGERLVGYRSDEIAGKLVAMFVPAAGREALNRRVLDVIHAGKAMRYEYPFLRKDGSQGEAEGTAVPIVVNARVTGLFLMSRDITDRARNAAALALQARRTGALYRLASEIGADADEQAGSALAFGLKELGYEAAFVVTETGDALTIERTSGAKLPVEAGDPIFRQLFRETIAGKGLLEAGEAGLKLRSDAAGEAPAFCRGFLGVPLDIGSGRYGALGFASRAAMPALNDFDREFVRAVGELAAVSIERANEDRRLLGLAHFDVLTGLPNRLLLGDRFAQAIAIAQRRGEHFSVYFIDIDKFKLINDTRGHQAGDEVLRAVARRLLQACRASDTVARLGGDEFIVLRSGPSADPNAEALALRLRAALEAPCEIGGVALQFTVGIGISEYPDHGKDEQTLLESADTALYLAKAAGAGSIRRFGAQADAGAAHSPNLERRDRLAVSES